MDAWDEICAEALEENLVPAVKVEEHLVPAVKAVSTPPRGAGCGDDDDSETKQPAAAPATEPALGATEDVQAWARERANKALSAFDLDGNGSLDSSEVRER